MRLILTDERLERCYCSSFWLHTQAFSFLYIARYASSAKNLIPGQHHGLPKSPKAATYQTSLGGSRENSTLYATENQRRIVQVCCSKKIIDFRLGIEVARGDALRQNELRYAS
jgi:hypothetical protein